MIKEYIYYSNVRKEFPYHTRVPMVRVVIILLLQN